MVSCLISLFDDRVDNNVKKHIVKKLMENTELEEYEFHTDIQKMDDVSRFLKKT